MKQFVNCYELTVNTTDDGVNVKGSYALYFYKENDAIAYAEQYAICGCKLTAKCVDPDNTTIF